MRVFKSNEEVEKIEDPELKLIILARVAELSEYVDHFSELVRFVLLCADDCLPSLENELGFTVVPRGAIAYRRCDAYEEHRSFMELVYVLSDDGSGIIVFIPKEIATPEIQELCCLYRKSESTQ